MTDTASTAAPLPPGERGELDRLRAEVAVLAGTRNHLALDLGLDREDVPAAPAAFGDAGERRIDVAELNGRVFVPAYPDAAITRGE